MALSWPAASFRQLELTSGSVYLFIIVAMTKVMKKNTGWNGFSRVMICRERDHSCLETACSSNKVLNVDAVKVKLQIWDTAGQERFRSVTHAYYRDAHALLLLYDVTNRASFDNIQAWLTEIHEYAQQDVVLMLLGNKVDSTQDRVVKREDGEKLAKEYGVPFMETSAKSGLNVDLAFTAIAKELKHRSMKLPNEPKFKLHDYVKKEVRGSGCCRS
ncbi:ras-related protein Rab-26 isoform X3 [Lepidochelys kempii]|uniref:ras-related protein Rab-26 isoform X3 n=1 Tax=Lepidochelys kempii TaxID=8472 RepID=UPI003C6FDDDA